MPRRRNGMRIERKTYGNYAQPFSGPHERNLFRHRNPQALPRGEGGWANIAQFGLAVAITWDAEQKFRRWFEPDTKELVAELGQFDRIVSFNGDRFDFEVLRGYHPVHNLQCKSFDLLADLQRRLGFRIKLDDLAGETLGYKKTGNGLEIVQWWREGRKEDVCSYCENDVKLLVDLMECLVRRTSS